MKTRVLATRENLPGRGLARLSEAADVVAWPGTGKPGPADLAALAPGASGVLALGNDPVDGALMDAAGPSLRVIALASMGFDNVDRAAAAARGIVVTHTPGVLAETTADLTFALILTARRRLGAAAASLAEGSWELFRMHDHLGLDIHGATLGLIGYGQIGRAVARRARGFGMRVLHHDPYAPDDDLSTSVGLTTLLAESDIVSLHVPLSEETGHLISARELATMKPTATLVSTSRGGVVGCTPPGSTSSNASRWERSCRRWWRSRMWSHCPTSGRPPRALGPPWSTWRSTTSSTSSPNAPPVPPSPAVRPSRAPPLAPPRRPRESPRSPVPGSVAGSHSSGA
jgi:glyoxylate reductase